MILRVLVVTLALSVLSLLPMSPAFADCREVESVRYVDGNAVITLVMQCDSTGGAETADVSSPNAPAPITNTGLSLCLAEGLLLNAGADYCAADPVAPVVTAGMVQAALRQVDIPASELTIQPPNGRTLVNFPTNFYTQPQPLNRTLTLLGQQVQLRITPTTYTWHFDTTTSRTTTTPGAAYPDLQVTHDYLRAGTTTPSVDTTYTADYRLGTTGAWQPVPGTVTIPGPTTPLEIVEAQPTLVDYE